MRAISAGSVGGGASPKRLPRAAPRQRDQLSGAAVGRAAAAAHTTAAPASPRAAASPPPPSLDGSGGLDLGALLGRGGSAASGGGDAPGATPAAGAAARALLAGLGTFSPSVFTPGVAAAVGAAGGGAPSPGGSNLAHIRAKLSVLKEQLAAKMAGASLEKRGKIEAQLARLERNLAYVEEQRVGGAGGGGGVGAGAGAAGTAAPGGQGVALGAPAVRGVVRAAFLTPRPPSDRPSARAWRR